jgi:hypothetical protein
VECTDSSTVGLSYEGVCRAAMTKVKFLPCHDLSVALFYIHSLPDPIRTVELASHTEPPQTHRARDLLTEAIMASIRQFMEEDGYGLVSFFHVCR